ncbi:hypothetical protein EC973_007690 [Apophysomyces ossiformis]|uniref:Arrestin C-terminal-like domain-containing protein n=1 Tax=Apophysomyces ossiformis TaxID=679940 RepID=A0A8H7C0K0_9FUNG|nr:hypothetical protein EC973_007690 [Apophysomyces ossiformis]
MLFSRNPGNNGIRSFTLSVRSGGQLPVAFGPGSVINGSALLTLDKSILAHNIRVVFKCEEMDMNKTTTTLFSVEALVWGKAASAEEEPHELVEGSHMYLFAIRLPLVNYPPSIRDTYVGHQIEYSVQGFLELQSDTLSCAKTAPVPVMYLPLVTCMPLDNNNLPTEPPTKMELAKSAQASVGITAQLIKPAYCPGDTCTVKLIVDNQSEGKITSVQISLVSTVSTLAQPNADGNDTSMSSILSNEAIRRQRHTLHSETFYVSVKKQSKDQSIFQFRVPPNSVPTTQNYIGKYLEISYEVIVSVPLTGTGVSESTPGGVWSSLSFTSTPTAVSTIALPIIIATVPPSYPVPHDLQILRASNGAEPEKPSFIPNIESPLPSPSSPFLGSGSWGPGSPADSERLSMSPSNSFRLEEGDMGESEISKADISCQDATGHLMVPSLTENSSRDSRRRSVGSNASDCVVEVNAVSDTGGNMLATQ